MNYKVSKKTNRQLIESLFNQIETTLNFHIINKEYTNEYFIAKGTKDSICHFEIKEIPGFLFGIWTTNRFASIKESINDDDTLWSDSLHICSKSEIVFFTQYKIDIDKFKPSRGGFVTGLYRIKYEDDEGLKEEWLMYDLEEILLYMKKHPIKSVTYSNLETKYLWSVDKCSIWFLKMFIKDWYYYFKYKIRDKFKYFKQLYLAKRLVRKLSEFNYIIYTYKCSDDIQIKLRHKDNCDFEKYLKQIDIIDTYIDRYICLLDVSLFEVDLEILKTKEDRKEDTRLKRIFYNTLKEDKDLPRVILATNIESEDK